MIYLSYVLYAIELFDYIPVVFVLLLFMSDSLPGINNCSIIRHKSSISHIWYIPSSRGPLPKLFKLFPCGQKCVNISFHLLKECKIYILWHQQAQ